jgi:hypothetical protein
MATDKDKSEPTRKPLEIDDLPQDTDAKDADAVKGGRARMATWDTGDEIVSN